MTWAEQPDVSPRSGPAESGGEEAAFAQCWRAHNRCPNCSQSVGLGLMTKGWGCLGKDVRGLSCLQPLPLIFWL